MVGRAFTHREHGLMAGGPFGRKPLAGGPCHDCRTAADCDVDARAKRENIDHDDDVRAILSSRAARLAPSEVQIPPRLFAHGHSLAVRERAFPDRR